jgi:hypothetical protein
MQNIQLKDRRTYHKADKFEIGHAGMSTCVNGDMDANT